MPAFALLFGRRLHFCKNANYCRIGHAFGIHLLDGFDDPYFDLMADDLAVHPPLPEGKAGLIIERLAPLSNGDLEAF